MKDTLNISPEPQLVSDEILSKLCHKDKRNPDGQYSYTSPEDLDDIPEPRVKCSCDNCFYGKDQLAMEIIRLAGLVNTDGHLSTNKLEGDDILVTRFSDWTGDADDDELVFIDEVDNMLEFDALCDKAKEVIDELENKTGLTLWPNDIYQGAPMGLFGTIGVPGVFDLVSIKLMKNGYNVYNDNGVFQIQKAPSFELQLGSEPQSESTTPSRRMKV